MNETLGTAGPSGGDEAAFPVGSWEHPDPAGIALRGAAVGFRGYVERYGEPPVCFVGSRPARACERPAAMEVYGLPMCEVHGEEAASGALTEIAYDMEQELQRPMNPHVRALSPHLERALMHGFGSLAGGAGDEKRDEEVLLEAFPLDRGRTDSETLAYVEDRFDHRSRRSGAEEPPYDAFMDARMLLCRHMRLAFEAGADWLVETLERERESAAAQAAYALALEREAGFRR